MKVLLVIPPSGYLSSSWSRENIMPPLGVGYLAAVLEENNIEVEILDAFIEGFSWQQLGNYLARTKPDLVGISFATETRFEGFRTIKIAKKSLPNSLVVAGGPHVSLAAEDTLLHLPELDVIVRGEGEYTLLELAKNLEMGKAFEQVLGISFRRGNKIIHNPSRPFVENLDQLSFPARHLLSMDKYNLTIEVPEKGKLPAMHMMTSRGCPIGCNFCATSQMLGRRWRMRSAENVVREIEELIQKYKIKGIWFFDDTFTLNRERTERICQLILERNLDINWHCDIRVDTVDRELLKLMKEAGCYRVCFGVESGSQRIIDQVIGKKIKIDQVRQVSHWCDELGILKYSLFIISHPTETIEEAHQTLQLMQELKNNGQVTISLLKIYPGTRLEQLAKEKGFLPENFSWSEEYNPKTILLPSITGQAPIFIDKLSWSEISQILFQWREISGYSIWKRLPETFRNIRSFNDLIRILILAKEYCLHQLRKII